MKTGGQTRRAFVLQLAALTGAGASGLMNWAEALAGTAANALRGVAGAIIRRDEASYLSWWASMTWYIFKPKRYPEILVRAESEKDVVETINYARENGLRVSVRSTGHNPAKSVLRDGGILLDLSLMREVEVDAATRTAWIQPGIRASELSQITLQHGLVFPAAHTGLVGLGGYLLGGGLGWNIAEYGMACRSILGAEIITADGKKTYASPDGNQDLLWAIRGVGPGFFGAAVRYKLQLYPVHQAIEVSTYMIPAERLAEALKELEAIGNSCDRRLEILIKIGHFHPVDKPYAERDLVCAAQFFAFADTAEDAKSLMSPVAGSGIAALSVWRRENIPVTYRELYLPPETDHSSPNRTVVENMWTDDPVQALQLLTDRMIAEPPRSPRSFLLCGWSYNETFKDPGACILTAGKHYMSWYMIAETEDDIGPNYEWMDASLALMNPFSRGRYINEIDSLRYPHQVEECFAAEDWEKLEGLRRQYDPRDVFFSYLGHDSPAP